MRVPGFSIEPGCFEEGVVTAWERCSVLTTSGRRQEPSPIPFLSNAQATGTVVIWGARDGLRQLLRPLPILLCDWLVPLIGAD